MCNRKILHFVCLICLSQTLVSQSNKQALPPSFEPALQSFFEPAITLPLPAIDLVRIRKENEAYPGNRIASPSRIDVGLQRGGSWTQLPNGDRVWRIHLQSVNGLATMAFYENFYLPPGAALYMYSLDKTQLLGPYTAKDNPKGKRFMTGLIQGQDALIEYVEPAVVGGQGHFDLFRVDQVFDPEGLKTLSGQVQGGSGPGFGSSNACHANINCPLGSTLQKEKRGIVRIMVVVEEGIGICSGNLMNNTRKDGTPYILSGFHCMDGYTPLYDLWRFDFNYESPNCDNPISDPGAYVLTGSVFRAGRQESDFLLLELMDTIPPAFNAYFLGWDRQPSAPDTSYIIHHPNADIKKVAASYQPVTVLSTTINWNNGVTTPRNHHYDVRYSIGSFEVGSSGSALLDEEGLVIGQLNGGQADAQCESTRGWFGRLNLSWTGASTDATSLKSWLDPDGLEPDTLHGMENPQAAFVSGHVYNPEDFGVAGVILSLSYEDQLILTSTDTNGYYQFPPIPAGKSYDLIPTKIENLTNGVSTLDIIETRRHILNIAPFDSPFKFLAADVDHSGTITTLDLIYTQRLIIGLEENFPGVASWQFIPGDYVFQNAAMPLSEAIPAVYLLENAQGKYDLEFIGFKSGDVNLTADPRE
ncbi:MAG: hypothetical protein R2828_33265 [Saprospiraceae bacterium]